MEEKLVTLSKQQAELKKMVAKLLEDKSKPGGNKASNKSKKAKDSQE